MPIYRSSLIFAVTTQPVNPIKAFARSGGWSEGFWSTFNPSGSTQLNQIANLRAAMLPAQVSVTGFRVAVFNIDGNRLQPAGTSAGKFLFPGATRYSVDVPQAGLEMSFPAVGAPNNARPVLRGLPDEVVVNGEYSPDPTFSAAFNRYVTALNVNGFGFVGRDLASASARVLAITAGVVNLSQVLAGVAIGDFLRFHRVTNTLGRPISGAFLVTNIAGQQYTLSGLGANAVIVPSGTARKDTLSFFAYAPGTFGSVVVKKIGRPSRGYRGRRSKMPA